MNLDRPVRDLMTADPRTVSLTDALTDVHTFMLNGGFHHVPVVEGPRLVGMLSATDMMAVLRDLPPELADTGVVLDESRTVATLMTRQVETLDEQATLRDAAELFATGRFHALPIVRGGDLVGILTTTDLIRSALAQS